MKPFGTTTTEDRMYASNEGMSAVVQGTRQRARVICNPSSGGGSCDPSRLREQLSGFDLDWSAAKGPGDAREAAQEWDEGLLVVAGGDDAINEIVNGLGRSGFSEGVTLAIPEDANEAEAVIWQGRVCALDVARVHSGGVGGRFFLNVATSSLRAEISVASDKELKYRWGKLSYLQASLAVVPRALNVIVGPGRRMGYGESA